MGVGEVNPSRWKSKCKGPEAEIHVVCLRNTKEANVMKVECRR